MGKKTVCEVVNVLHALIIVLCVVVRPTNSYKIRLENIKTGKQKKSHLQC